VTGNSPRDRVPVRRASEGEAAVGQVYHAREEHFQAGERGAAALGLEAFERGPNLLLTLLVQGRHVFEPQDVGVKPEQPDVHLELARVGHQHLLGLPRLRDPVLESGDRRLAYLDRRRDLDLNDTPVLARHRLANPERRPRQLSREGLA
jgi:hypothetical protein